MKVLHTSDWHLGLNLMGRVREDEQRAVVASVTEAVRKHDVDLVLLAGDVYDSRTPPVWATELFCTALRDFCDAGALTVIIAGNHDSPDGLCAVSPLATEHGAYIIGTPAGAPHTKGRGFVSHENGSLTLLPPKANRAAVIAAIPYVSEARAQEVFECEDSYANAIRQRFEIASREFKDGAVNLAVAHLFTANGIVAGDERAIEGVGNSALVPADALPSGAAYVALGHLHRPQQVARNAFYSGSLLHNRFGEGAHDKAAMLVDVDAAGCATVAPIPLTGGRKLTRKTFDTVAEAVSYCESDDNPNDWLELRIGAANITHAENEAMRKRRPLLIRIEAFGAAGTDAGESVEKMRSVTPEELFTRLYKKQNNKEPGAELLKLFSLVFNSEEAAP